MSAAPRAAATRVDAARALPPTCRSTAASSAPAGSGPPSSAHTRVKAKAAPAAVGVYTPRKGKAAASSRSAASQPLGSCTAPPHTTKPTAASAALTSAVHSPERRNSEASACSSLWRYTSTGRPAGGAERIASSKEVSLREFCVWSARAGKRERKGGGGLPGADALVMRQRRTKAEARAPQTGRAGPRRRRAPRPPRWAEARARIGSASAIKW